MFESFSDIQLDVPHAHTSLEKFTDMCARDGIVPISLTMKVPSRYETQSISKYCSPFPSQEVICFLVSVCFIKTFIHPAPLPLQKGYKELIKQILSGSTKKSEEVPHFKDADDMRFLITTV